MPAPPPDPAISPEAALLRLAWETVQATARPRPARVAPDPASFRASARWRRPRRRDR
jgi:hypothetical protein